MFLLFFLLFTHEVLAMPGSSCSLTKMPQYVASFVLPEMNNSWGTSASVIIRYYEPWGDGSRDGWKEPVIKPVATINGIEYPVRSVFAYSEDVNQRTYLTGPMFLGFDQYAQYLSIPIPNLPGAMMSIRGDFQPGAYMSITLYYYDKDKLQQFELFDNELTTDNVDCNPYVFGHPSVFAYQSSIKSVLLKALELPEISHNEKLKQQLPIKKSVEHNTGRINVFRIDKQTTVENLVDDIAADGCSRAYLYAEKNPEQEVVILRLKVPTSFIGNDHPDKLFRHYQTRYISVGAHRSEQSSSEKYLTYWAVNGRMLNDFVDRNGYAYVFFAPYSYVDKLAQEQQTPPGQPPVMRWGHYKGYVLGDPSFAIILRYRMPDPHWKGSPENAVCYSTVDELRPIAANELGDYLPEIYGDTLANFENGHIGVVEKDKHWPRI